MKYYVLATALLLGACNAKPEDKTAADAAKPAADAKPTAPALPGKEVSLASSNIPVVLQAPEGTTVEKGKYGGVALKGPKFLVNVSEIEGAPEKAAEMMANAKDMTKRLGMEDVVVAEPLVFYAGKKGADPTYNWVVLVPDEAAKKFYILETSKDVARTPGYVRADIDQMLAYARTAKLAK